MLILNQRKDRVVNLDQVESIIVGYHIGKPYSVKAIFDANLNNEVYEKLGEYESSLTAESVIQSIYMAYANEARCFSMPEDMHNAGF